VEIEKVRQPKTDVLTTELRRQPKGVYPLSKQRLRSANMRIKLAGATAVAVTLASLNTFMAYTLANLSQYVTYCLLNARGNRTKRTRHAVRTRGSQKCNKLKVNKITFL